MDNSQKSQDQSLDESLIQVIPNKKEAEKKKQYNNLILANETGIKFDESKIKQYIINPEKVVTNNCKEIEKCDHLFKSNPQFVIEYIDDIVTYYKEAELVNSITSDYMKNQSDVTPRMRAILIDWLVEVIFINEGSFKI